MKAVKCNISGTVLRKQFTQKVVARCFRTISLVLERFHVKYSEMTIQGEAGYLLMGNNGSQQTANVLEKRP